MSTSPDPHTWNRLYPVGSAMEIRLANGDTVSTKTMTAAYLWGGLALVEVDALPGPFTLDALRPATGDDVNRESVSLCPI